MGRRTTIETTGGDAEDVRCPACYRAAVYWNLDDQFGIECVECGYSRAFTDSTSA